MYTATIIITIIIITETIMQRMGTFWGVGVGPGDPELVTLKAARALAEVDWIFCPAESTQGAGFAARIVAPLGLPAAKFRPVPLNMSRQRDTALEAYRSAAKEIVAELRQGRSAAWIAEGDPLFYSTFPYIAEQVRLLCAETRIEVVPGVSAVQAAAARVGLPLARLDEAMAVLPAAYGLERLPKLLDSCATVALLKVHSVFDSLLDRLDELPKDLQTVYLEKVGTSEERTTTDLHSLRGQKLPYFSLVLLRRGGQRRAGSRKRPEMDNNSGRLRDPARRKSCLFIVGLGPGARETMTGQALDALRLSRVVIGYSGYFDGIADLLEGKECLALPLGSERERAQLAVERARAGEPVCVISSGDAGIYGMASLVLETLETAGGDAGVEVAVIPGVSAVNGCAALLGAPLGHDFAVISLSDLLTPWEQIEKRLVAAARADFVLALLNPQSARRGWQLRRAQEILLQARSPETPTGIVRQAYRPSQSIEITTLGRLTESNVDMFSTVIIGNSQTRRFGDKLVTPRGYSASGVALAPREVETLGALTRPRSPEIIDESFRIIEREIGEHGFAAAEWQVVRRMIHASGDMELARLVCFHNGAVAAGVQALRHGAPIVTDVRMVAAGLNKAALEALSLRVHCFLDDPEVERRAAEGGRTRCACAMEKAMATVKRAVYVIGNAPTALLALSEGIRRGAVQPLLVVAAPVGFVAVEESKERAFGLEVPLIGVRGRKGGSAVAAAAVNALLLMAEEARQ
ncbi:MAG TPA: precorrin-3B C(17)-methyltransferase [Gemmataceae bacterium]|nr:precorrin-3B C(17)-methyltransferase [Gemmataceae bacterium]